MLIKPNNILPNNIYVLPKFPLYFYQSRISSTKKLLGIYNLFETAVNHI